MCIVEKEEDDEKVLFSAVFIFSVTFSLIILHINSKYILIVLNQRRTRGNTESGKHSNTVVANFLRS